MKILFFVTGFPSNQRPNQGIFNHNFTQIQRDFQFEICKIVSIKPGRPIFQKVTYEGIEYLQLAIYFPLGPWWLRKLIVKFLSNLILKKIGRNHDLVHCVGVVVPGFIGSQISRILKKPLLVQATGSDVYLGLNENGNDGLVNLIKGSKPSFICNSMDLKERLSKHFPNEPIDVVYRSPLNDNSPNQDKVNKNFEIKTICYLGGLINENTKGQDIKGGNFLIDFFSRKIELNNKLIVAGPGIEDQEIKRNTSPEVLNRISVLGNLNPKNVKDVIEESDFLIIPSSHEGMPNVLIEAFQMGVPVIGSRVGGIPEVIEDEVNGFLFESQNAESLSEVFVKINSLNFEQYQEMSKSALMTFKRRFNKELYRESYSSIYYRLGGVKS